MPGAANADGTTEIAVVIEAADRLDKALAAAVPAAAGLSRSRLQALIAEGAVADAAGVVLDDPRAKLAPGTEVVVRLPPPRPIRAAAEAIPLDIVFEDADLIVIDKPAGLVVHPAPGARRRHAGERAPAPLRRDAVGDRRAAPPGDRPPHRQGHLRAPGGGEVRRGAPRPGAAVRRPRPRAALPRGDPRRAGPGRPAARPPRRHQLGAGRRPPGRGSGSGGIPATASGWRC